MPYSGKYANKNLLIQRPPTLMQAIQSTLPMLPDETVDNQGLGKN